MAERRFFWIKIKNTFLTSKTVDFLMSQKNGANYVILYQMLCLMTINSNGELADFVGEVVIPFNENKIKRTTKYFKLSTIRTALELYKKLGLICENEQKILKIIDFNELIGSESTSTIRSRIYRENKILATQEKNKSVALQQNCNKNATQEIRYKRSDIINNYNSLRDPACTREEDEKPQENQKKEAPQVFKDFLKAIDEKRK